MPPPPCFNWRLIKPDYSRRPHPTPTQKNSSTTTTSTTTTPPPFGTHQPAQPDYDPLLPGTTYTELASHCKHIIHHSTPSELTIKLSRPASTYGPAQTWTDDLPLLNFSGVSAGTLLCGTCERVMRSELVAARKAYEELWEKGQGEGWVYAEALGRFRRATLRVANFEAEMDGLENSWTQVWEREGRERVWEGRRRVRFVVEVGMGAGEGKEKGEGKKAVIAGWK